MISNHIPTEELHTDFYDAMFGSVHGHGAMNVIERNTLAQIVKIANSPASLRKQVPLLPDMLISLLDALKDPHSDIFTFVDLIERDPSFAAEVLKVANTAKYNRSNNEIIYLRKATSFLGMSGLMKIASTLLLAEVIPCKPFYYKLYGRQIWTHSVQCATLCELLAKAEGKNEADAYFIGLIHDLGKIIVFNCLSIALGESFSSIMPCSREFKTLMTEMSMDISYFIAREWQLPALYIDALREQREKTRLELGSLLFRANRLSESYLLLMKSDISEEEYHLLQQELTISDEVAGQFKELASDIALNIR